MCVCVTFFLNFFLNKIILGWVKFIFFEIFLFMVWATFLLNSDFYSSSGGSHRVPEDPKGSQGAPENLWKSHINICKNWPFGVKNGSAWLSVFNSECPKYHYWPAQVECGLGEVCLGIEEKRITTFGSETTVRKGVLSRNVSFTWNWISPVTHVKYNGQFPKNDFLL